MAQLLKKLFGKNDADDNEEKKELSELKEDDSNAPEFSNHLLKILLDSNNEDRNIICSPFSILAAMSICMLGTATNTLQEMVNTLYPHTKGKDLTFNDVQKVTSDMLQTCNYYNKAYDGIRSSEGTDSDAPSLSIANKIWIAKGFKILDSYIKATGIDAIGSFDSTKALQAAQNVNNWVSDNTNKMINELVAADNMKGSVFVIVNAIYFNGKFIYPFDKKQTKENVSFFASAQRKKEVAKVSMMTSDENHLSVQKLNGVYDVVKLQYKESKLSLILAINNYTNKKEEPLKVQDIAGIKQWSYDKIELFVPKFKFEYRVELNNTLIQMGIKDAFDSKKADFTNMSSAEDLFIGLVIHKAVIDVNEKGTEAAAATAVMMLSGFAMPVESKTIRYDHSFTFYIFDEEKKNILFSGAFTGKQ